MKNIIALLLVLLAFFAGINIGGYFYQPPTLQYIFNNSYQASTEGLVPVEVTINQTTVYMAGNCKLVSFDVTQDQAYSIALGIQKSIGTRPLTHDILKDILDTFGIQILQVKIDRFENEIYYATIILRKDSRVLELDARPSDSIALALRTNTQIYFDKLVLEANGKNIC